MRIEQLPAQAIPVLDEVDAVIFGGTFAGMLSCSIPLKRILKVHAWGFSTMSMRFALVLNVWGHGRPSLF
ncbi:hypothetical protein [Fictibacillus terranigra]|uniref:Uncharacterized protein n=1 Tax=Fictibacillus terranigra TaxID=3058424 RepID=A0ABT8E513_9BACL|nr:hypothetical protein [Fictibacillus sp. CENA-BCM004]MDN4073001.1 hypothetical protein [Fictibacillus sp. CENA-BCM004]